MAWGVRQVASIKGLPLPCWHCDQYLERPFPFDRLYPSPLTVFFLFLLPLKVDGAISEALVHGLASFFIIISPLVALGKKAPHSSAVVALQPAVYSCGGVSKGLWAGGLSLSDESFPNEGARGAFAKPSRRLHEASVGMAEGFSARDVFMKRS